MQLYLDAAMSGKTGKEKYSMFLLAIGERGRDILSSWMWFKVVNADGVEMNEDDITVKRLFGKFGKRCIPKKNIIIEHMIFSISLP